MLLTRSTSAGFMHVQHCAWMSCAGGWHNLSSSVMTHDGFFYCRHAKSTPKNNPHGGRVLNWTWVPEFYILYLLHSEQCAQSQKPQSWSIHGADMNSVLEGSVTLMALGS